MKKSCEDIREDLVDYADGGLSTEQSSEVTEHLETCENCRKLLEALQKSLELATVIWEDGLKETESVKIPSRPKTGKIYWLRYVAVAAGILLVVTTLLVRRGNNKPKEPELSFEEIEKNINDSGNAAQLLAATELLADYPDAKEIVEQQYRYIAQTYPQTPAAAEIKLKIR
jgi:hypothetical protein